MPPLAIYHEHVRVTMVILFTAKNAKRRATPLGWRRLVLRYSSTKRCRCRCRIYAVMLRVRDFI